MKTIERIRGEIRHIVSTTLVGNMERLHELEGMLPTAELDVWAYFGDWYPELLRDGVILCHCRRNTFSVFKGCLPGPLGMWAGLPPHLPSELSPRITANWMHGPMAEEVFRYWASTDNQLSLELRADSFMPGFADMLFVPVSTSVSLLQGCWPSVATEPGKPRGSLLPQLKRLKDAANTLGGTLSYLSREPGYFVFVAGTGLPGLLHQVRDYLDRSNAEFAYIRTEGDMAIWEGSRLSSYGSVI